MYNLHMIMVSFQLINPDTEEELLMLPCKYIQVTVGKEVILMKKHFIELVKFA